MEKDATIRVLVVDDHPVVREGLAALVMRRPDLTVVGEAADGAEALEMYGRLAPDVTLMDLRMPRMDGVEAIMAIRREHPDARILVLTTYDGDADVYRALQAGAMGYLLKDAGRDELVSAIRALSEGRRVVPPEVAARLAEHVSRPRLTERELTVLRLVAEGKSNRAIAQELFVAEGTVKSHVNSILLKLSVSDRTQAATEAIRRGIIHAD